VEPAYRRFEAGSEYRRAVPHTHTTQQFGFEKCEACEIRAVPCRQKEMIDLPRAPVIEFEYQLVATG
jgi:hypothetical protein